MLMVARRDGHADLADVRSLVPLRDTTDELCTVAKGLKLSTGARETNIKALSTAWKLAPGLIFTPPKGASATKAISRPRRESDGSPESHFLRVRVRIDGW